GGPAYYAPGIWGPEPSIYSGRGEARVHAGHDPGRRERLGRLAPLLELRTPGLHAPRPPGPLLRPAAEGSRRAGAGPLPRLLRVPGRHRLVPPGGALPGARGPRPAAAALRAARRPLPRGSPRRPVRVRGHLAGAGLPARVRPALRGRARPAVGGARVGRGAAGAARDRKGPGGAGVAGDSSRPRRRGADRRDGLRGL
ncbi:MAG: hypothetical protein AVDCRST_MAG05-4326, partial [uncultured Rubrobacteraceae bacterium]